MQQPVLWGTLCLIKKERVLGARLNQVLHVSGFTQAYPLLLCCSGHPESSQVVLPGPSSQKAVDTMALRSGCTHALGTGACTSILDFWVAVGSPYFHPMTVQPLYHHYWSSACSPCSSSTASRGCGPRPGRACFHLQLASISSLSKAAAPFLSSSALCCLCRLLSQVLPAHLPGSELVSILLLIATSEPLHCVPK